MLYLEYILWGYFIGYPIYIYCTHEQEKQMVLAQPEKLIPVYRVTMLYLWLPTAVVLALVWGGSLSLTDLGLHWHWGLETQIAVGLLILVTGLFCVQIVQTKKSAENQQALIKQMAQMSWFMPKNVGEAGYFIFGVSVTAGICEELLFRGYLLNLFDLYLPTYAAVILSSLAFGAGHIYQGYFNVLRTAVMGAVLAVIYLLTESLFIVIYLHIIMDMLGGVLAYISYTSQQQAPTSDP